MSESKINFEEGFMYRSNKSITSRNDIALTELIANAWDAGATSVSLTIPKSVDKFEPIWYYILYINVSYSTENH